MMADLDHWLNAIRSEPSDERLARMDAAVMQGLVRHRDRTTAIWVGWAGSLVPGAPAQAASLPIGMSDYAPSSLLGQ